MSADIEMLRSPAPASKHLEECEEVDPLLQMKNKEPTADIENPAPVSKLLRTESNWGSAPQLKSQHTIFLSHSGAQKNFVEQLCEDLERANQVPFFDKRPDSLPKGEKFAQLIFQAAQQCELAIVVVSEEYFSRTKWPMLELAAFVQAGKCTILPLFLGMSCKEFSDVKRREAWFERWDEWAMEEPRIHVDVWKAALRDLDARNGLEYSQALGEVSFRKEVVATACLILQKKVSLREQVLPQKVLNFFKGLGMLVFGLCTFVVFAIVFFKVIFPLFVRLVEPILDEIVQVPPPPKPEMTCIVNGQPITPCPWFFHKP